MDRGVVVELNLTVCAMALDLIRPCYVLKNKTCSWKTKRECFEKQNKNGMVVILETLKMLFTDGGKMSGKRYFVGPCSSVLDILNCTIKTCYFSELPPPAPPHG